MAVAGAVWLPVLPEMSRFSRQVRRGATANLAATGKAAGRSYAKGMTGAVSAGGIAQTMNRETSAGAAAGARAVQKATTTVTKARDKAANAAGQVRVAEARLSDLRAKGTASSGQITAAEQRLAKAQRTAATASQDAAVAQRHLVDIGQSTQNAFNATGESAAASAVKTSRFGRVTSRAMGAARDGVWRMASSVPAVGNFAAGLRDSSAAASALTGRAGTMGGQVRAAMSRVTGGARAALGGFTRLGTGIRGIASRVGQSIRGGMVSPLGSMTRTLGLIGGLSAFAGVAGSAVRAATTIEDTKLSLEGMYGSGKQANDMMARLKKLSASSPIEYAQYAKAAQNLAYMDIKGRDAEQVLRNVGNAAIASGKGSEGINRASDAMLQMVNSGKVYAQQLNQISDAGVPVFDALASHFDTNIENVREMVQAGKVGIDDVMEVIQQGEGPIFEKMNRSAENVSKSMSNQFKQLKDNVAMSLGGLLAPMLRGINGVMGKLPAMASYLRPVVDAFKQLAMIAGGALKAAWSALSPVLMPVLGLLKNRAVITGVAALVAGYAAWAAVTKGVSVATWALNAAMRANPVGLIIGGITALVAVMVYAWNNSETFRAVLTATWNGIKAVAMAVFTAVKTAVMALVTAFTTAWNWIGSIVSTTWHAIRNVSITVWNSIVAFFTGAFAVFRAFFGGVWRGIKAVFTSVWHGIKAVAMVVWRGISAYFRAVFAVYRAFFTAVWTGIKAVFTRVWYGIKTVAVTVWNAIKAFFVAAFNTYKAIFTAVWHAVKAVFTRVWHGIKAVAVAVWNGIKAFFVAAFNAYRALFTRVWHGIKAVFTSVWRGIKAAAVAIWNGIRAFFTGAFNAFRAFFSRVWNGIKNVFSSVWHGIRSVAGSVWGSISSFFSGALSRFTGWWRNVWTGIKDTFKSVFGGVVNIAEGIWKSVKGAFKAGINSVTGFMNKWFIGPINKVLGKFKLKIPTIPEWKAAGGILGDGQGAAPAMMAAGGRVGGGFTARKPTAIVGEGNTAAPEYVIPTDRKHRSRAIELYRSLGNKLMAGGGTMTAERQGPQPRLLGIGGILSSAWDGVKSAAGGVGKFVKGLGKKALKWASKGALWMTEKLVDPVVNKVKGILPDNLIGNIGTGTIDKTYGGIKDFLRKMAGETKDAREQKEAEQYGGKGGAAPKGQVTNWIKKALSILGKPQSWQKGLYQQVMTESGGNPKIIQQIQDINSGGNEARGLMQVIPPTFAAHKLPGHGNIYNPVDNLIAGIRYALSRYGSSWFNAGPHHSHGYDSGGLLPPGLSTVYNGTGRPEAVLTGRQWQTLVDDRDRDTVAPQVRVFIGDEEITSRIDARIENDHARTARALRSRR